MERKDILAIYEAGPEAVINVIEQLIGTIVKLEGFETLTLLFRRIRLPTGTCQPDCVHAGAGEGSFRISVGLVYC